MKPHRMKPHRSWIVLVWTIELVTGGLFSTMPGLAAPDAAELRKQGLAYRDQGQFEQAIEALKLAVQLAPDDLPGRVSLGWTFHLAQQDRAAAATLTDTLQRDPFHVPALNALGIVYLFNDDPVAAAATHSWAAFLDPSNEIPHYNLSLAWQRLDQPAWAIASAKTAARLEPDNPHPLVALAIAQWSNGDKAAARRSFQQAIAVDARYGDAEFLDFLNEAGFSSAQIALAKQVLAS